LEIISAQLFLLEALLDRLQVNQSLLLLFLDIDLRDFHLIEPLLQVLDVHTKPARFLLEVLNLLAIMARLPVTVVDQLIHRFVLSLHLLQLDVLALLTLDFDLFLFKNLDLHLRFSFFQGLVQSFWILLDFLLEVEDGKVRVKVGVELLGASAQEKQYSIIFFL
jgi:hypothetical protein